MGDQGRLKIILKNYFCKRYCGYSLALNIDVNYFLT